MLYRFAIDPAGRLLRWAGTRWRDIRAREDNGLQLGLPVAIGAHILVFWIAAGGLDGLLPVQIAGMPNAPPARAIGDKAGELDGVAAEVIDAAEFDKRYVSFKAGRDAADTEATIAATKSAAAKAVPQQAIDQPELPPDTGPGRQTSPTPAKPQDPKPPAEPALSEADIAELLANSREELQGSVEAHAMPGSARLGEASPFVRGVIRLLKKNMPRATGIKGRVVVQFLVSDTGTIEAARVLRGSGRPELDRRVLDSVISAQFAVPGKETTMHERMFQITYHYD